MRIYYDDEVDALYLQIGNEDPEGVTEIAEGINLDLTKSGKLVGIEITDASKKTNLETFLSYSIETDKTLLSKSNCETPLAL
ncbi:MAG: DUF2283 domain-containing protein [SAR324 cluster bacterium]|nr:DUF2283 domain-containing protein [SAR324 cluster bacterium]